MWFFLTELLTGQQLINFRAAYQLGPIYTCICCIRSLEKRSVVEYTQDVKQKIEKVLMENEKLQGCLQFIEDYKVKDEFWHIIWSCQICDKQLQSQEDCYEHIQNEHGQTPFSTVSECSILQNDGEWLKQFQCLYCPTEYNCDEKHEFYSHVEIEHGVLDSSNFIKKIKIEKVQSGYSICNTCNGKFIMLENALWEWVDISYC